MWIPAVLVLGTGIGALSYVYAKLPLTLHIAIEQTSVLKDRNGAFLAEFHGVVDRTEIPLKEMPRVLRMAVIAAEDEDFYDHSGVDFMAIARAAWTDIIGGGIVQGGSTITQQYVRNAYPEVGTEKTITRKVKESLLALKLEQELSKNDILERYLNTIYLGQGAYGVEAAAQTYFDLPAKELNILQSAVLAGIISSPDANNPVTNPEAALERRNYVLGRMAEIGFISPERASTMAQRPLRKGKVYRPKWERSDAAYYIDYTKRWLEQRYGGETFSGGLRISGTLDSEWQSAAIEAIENHPYEYLDNPEVSLVAVDVETGEIRAMVGGRDFRESRVNLATGEGGTGRQAGSAFKPFTLLTAIDEGISLHSTFNGPAEIEIEDFPCPDWKISNYGESGQGTMDLISATANSVNTIYAQLMTLVGPDDVISVARDMGIESKLKPIECGITLGIREVTPLEMAEAFATFAALGVHHESVPVRQVKGPDGELLDEFGGNGRRPEWLDPNEAAQAIHAMKQVVCCGTGTVAQMPFPVFGKTGTTDDAADVWFCGASTEVAACVWVGHPAGRISMGEATGGTIAAPIWADFMRAIHEGLETGDWPTPEFTGTVPEMSDFVILSSPSPEPEPVYTEEPEPSPSPEPEPTEEPTVEPTEEPTDVPTTPPTEPPGDGDGGGGNP